MTTLDELERSVERLNRAVERLSGGMGKYGFANVYNDDLRLLLSERAELLATLDRTRVALREAAAALDHSTEVFESYANNTAARVMKMRAQEARAALTTGEAGSPIGQNDQPGLAFSDAGEP